MDRRTCLQALAGATTSLNVHPIFAAQDRLRIGLTPVILADQMAFLSKWGRYLSERVNCQVEFVSRESYQAVLDLLFSRQIDSAWICGYPFVRFEKSLNLLAVPMYQNNPVYQAYLIRSKSRLPFPSPASRLETLVSRLVSLPCLSKTPARTAA